MIFGLSLFAAPADNFKAAGIGLGGSISFNTSNNNFLNDEDKYKSSSSNFYISPNVEFMIIDNLSLSLHPRFSYNASTTYYDSDNNNYNEFETTDSYTRLGADLYATYYVTSIGEIVPFGGIFFGLSNRSNLDDVVDGETVEDKYSYISYNYGFNLGTLYFLTDRLSIGGSANFSFNGSKTLTYSNGDKHEPADDYKASEWLDINVNIYVGISYYFPNSEKLIVSK